MVRFLSDFRCSPPTAYSIKIFFCSMFRSWVDILSSCSLRLWCPLHGPEAYFAWFSYRTYTDVHSMREGWPCPHPWHSGVERAWSGTGVWWRKPVLCSRRGGFLNARAWTCCCSCFTMFLCGVCLCVCICKFFVNFWGERLHFQKMNANLYFNFCLLLLVACHCWSFKVQEELRALQGNKKRHLSTFLDLLPAAFQVWANAKTWIVNILNLWYSCYICSVERCSDGFEVHM